MKTINQNVIKILIAFTVSVILFSIFHQTANAQDYKPSQTSVYNGFIDHVTYNFETGEYIGVTTQDNDGGVWSVIIVKKLFNNGSVEWLNKKYIGKKLYIQYSGNVNVDDTVEIMEIGWVKTER